MPFAELIALADQHGISVLNLAALMYIARQLFKLQRDVSYVKGHLNLNGGTK